MSGNNTNDTDAEFKTVLDSTFEKLSSTLTNIGYADGASTGREAGIQTGFDLGYAKSLVIGLQIAAIKAFMETAADCNNAEVANEIEKFKQMYTSVFPETCTVDNIELQSVILNQILEKLKQEFPQIHSLIIIK